jgi:UDP-N-acetylmuramoyl-tripeptide--D-alanyl-D-alanine ligase
VLGDMLELGSISEECHRGVGVLASSSADAVFCFGEESRFICEEFKKSGKDCFYFDDKALLSESLKAYLKKGDAVLFKASRGMKFEEIINRVFEGK